MDPTPAHTIAPGQPFAIDRFRPEDAAGVVKLLRSVYGDAYPQASYYDPAWLTAANASGDVISVVARTPQGDIVSHMAVYRSEPANAALYEAGVGLTLPHYRGAHAASRIVRFIGDLLPALKLAGIYSEVVCNHLITQRFCAEVGMTETAIELDLLPAEPFHDDRPSGRVSCVLAMRPLRAAPQTLHVPARYVEPVRFILGALPGVPPIITAGTAPLAPSSQLVTRHWDYSAVSRCQLRVCGQDFANALADMEHDADARRCSTRQVFLNLSDPAIGHAADWLGAQGYSLAGIAPRWFAGDGDGLLLQKLNHTPGFERIQLYRERAQRLLALVEADWRQVNR